MVLRLVPPAHRQLRLRWPGRNSPLDSIAEATALVGGDLGNDLLGDVYASADYRRNMAGVELKHALYHAVGLAHH